MRVWLTLVGVVVAAVTVIVVVVVVVVVVAAAAAAAAIVIHYNQKILFLAPSALPPCARGTWQKLLLFSSPRTESAMRASVTSRCRTETEGFNASPTVRDGATNGRKPELTGRRLCILARGEEIRCSPESRVAELDCSEFFCTLPLHKMGAFVDDIDVAW